MYEEVHSFGLNVRVGECGEWRLGKFRSDEREIFYPQLLVVVWRFDSLRLPCDTILLSTLRHLVDT